MYYIDFHWQVLFKTFSFQFADGTAFDNYNPVVWRFGEKNKENGIYMALTDSPGGMQFNITDLSTKG